MSKYEVFIPAAMASEFNVTLKVDADNWMAALKTGLKRIGEGGGHATNILVDIMEDNSIHVTDPGSGRVFRIKELEEVTAKAPIALTERAAAPVPLVQQAARVAPPPQKLEPKPVEAKPEPQPLEPKPLERKPLRPGAQSVAELDRTERAAIPARAEVDTTIKMKPAEIAAAVERETRDAVAEREPTKKAAAAPARAPAPARKVAAPVPAARQSDSEPAKVEQLEKPSQPVKGPIGRGKSTTQLEDVFADLFERTQEIFGKKPQQAMDYLLDLALEKIPAESGSVFMADLASTQLEATSVRGPKADALKRMSLKMPVGVGIVGFCAQEAVSLAISDTNKDPRFYRQVSEKIGYPTSSILCAPMVSGGRSFGCIEIINKKGNAKFSDSEVAILSYVAHQGAKFLETVS